MKPAILLSDHLFRDTTSNRPAVINADGTGKHTYKELAADAANIATMLSKLGLGRGSVVALHIGNVPEFAAALLAVIRLQAVAALCNPLSPEEEQTARLTLVRADAIITAGSTTATARAAAQKAGTKHVVTDWQHPNVSGKHQPPTNPCPDDPSLIVFSSGTTGPPKAAVLTQRSLGANLSQAAVALPLAKDDIFLAPRSPARAVCERRRSKRR
jgi:acyl-CoA synthetase (AMP-forming)/AMP-acid ligase II